MTLEEKRDYIDNFCNEQSECNKCRFGNDETSWCENYNIYHMPEEECDKVLAILNGQSSNTQSNNVNHPSHYNREGSIECIDEMVTVFGKEAVKNFCLCNVWKYRYRASDKNGIEDLKKSDWYMNKYKELISNEQAASV